MLVLSEHLVLVSHWESFSLPLPQTTGFPYGSAGKESTCNVEDLGLTPGLGRSPGEAKGYQLQYSYLENSMDYTVYRVTKSRAQLSFHYYSGSFCEAVSQGCGSI